MSQLFTYQLTFSSANTSPNNNQVHIFITQNRDVDTWYFPFLGSYIFKSRKTLAELQPQFFQFFGSTVYTLSFLTPTLIAGALPQSVWQWVNNTEASALPSP